MIVLLAIAIALVLLYFAYQAIISKTAFWFFHDVSNPFIIDDKDIKSFNIRIATTLILFSGVFLIPTSCSIVHMMKESLYIMLMCSSITILIFITMVYWHHLYKTYNKYS